MTPDRFRQLALAMEGAEEGSHMGHPDFRANGRIFASLAKEEEGIAMVKLTPEQQEEFMDAAPEVFEPCQGAWGMGGATYMHLKEARVPMVRKAVEHAWSAAMAARPGRKRKK